jgi:hypothetical protein
MVLTLILFSCSAYSQPTPQVETFRDIAGTPFFPRTYIDVNGNPYLFDDFETSTIVLNNGQVLKNIKTNFNLVSNELIYLDETGSAMVASSSAVKTVEVGRRKFIPSPSKNIYCEVISTENKAVLLRIYKKRVVETKAFNSATVQRSFTTTNSHVLAVGGTVTEIKTADDLYEALSPSEGLKEFAKKEKLRAKSENSWVKIVNYYNSI